MEEFDSGVPDNEKQKLKEALKGITLPGDLESKTLVALKQRGAFADRPLYKIVLAFSFTALIFTTGFFVGKSVETSAVITDKEKYLLMLYEPEGFIADASQAQEYGAWARNLYKQGIMADGEELAKESWMINAKEIIIDKENLFKPTGFFIINTSSKDAAFEIAKSCPHLKYNGTIQLRPIQKH